MQKNTGIKRIILAAGYSILGIKAAVKHEAAFRQELLLAIILIPLAFWLDVEPSQRVLMVATLFLVMIVELLNSAIEAIVDRIGPEKHELSGRAKDLGSAAVMGSLILSVYIWGESLWALWSK
ncbi:diacylglycerol kinase (ATP) [Desulfuromusa kysingii]|uniref:Diacylglycerol kinase n=1 Tax=Desulfuromusa kysingii TaxID=37625 RepID=A0A1H4AT52_9BACT|nr:diacylglycerol kinase [Desulfuromusa kysingii]SEA39031.1 diacylglycerol kinase (ATP) [Desulfuromusa kysingii]